MASPHKARKRFGQNFLTDLNIIDKLVRTISPKPTDNIVEIGPGQGALTQPLIAECHHLTAVEIDRDLVKRLKQTFDESALTLHETDALKFDFIQLVNDKEPLRIVGNLPYNISTPLLFHLLGYLPNIKDMHFMLQKEVIDRLAAQPSTKAYGRLSVMVQSCCKVDFCFLVPPEAFSPRPKVTSAIVKLTPFSTSLDLAKRDFLAQVVKYSFAQRRKTLKNNLKPYFGEQLEQIDQIDFSQRPEQLSVTQYLYLAEQLIDLKP